MKQTSPPFFPSCSMKLMHMIEMQHMDDRNTTVPDWFVKFYDSGYLEIAFGLACLVIVVLVIIACRLYYESKELQRFIDEHKND